MKIRKKIKYKKVYWLLADLGVALIILVLLLYRPARYNPPDITYDKQVSSYLTHELLPQLYNGAQRQEPFDIVIIQENIKDIVAESKWPREYDGIKFSAPNVLFIPDSIVLMGTATLKGVKFVVTVVAEPRLDEKGLLNLHVAKVKIGAMNITPLAGIIARRMYQHQLTMTNIDKEDLRVQIAASLLNDEPFEPVFEIEDKKVRIEKIIIEQEKLTICLVPAPS